LKDVHALKVNGQLSLSLYNKAPRLILNSPSFQLLKFSFNSDETTEAKEIIMRTSVHTIKFNTISTYMSVNEGILDG